MFTDQQIDYIINKYVNYKNASFLSISKEFNVSPQMIKRVVSERGVKIKSLRDYRMVYDVNENYFNKIDSEEKAYWLGFLYADGVVNEDENLIRINLSYIDRNHLVKFKNSVASTHPIKTTTKKTKEKTYKGVYIGFKTEKMVVDLVEKGCYQRKSKTLLFPTSEIVPNEFLRHFIRGYFDGDGSINFTYRKGTDKRMYKMSFVGTENMVKNLSYFLNLSAKIQEFPNHCVLQFGGNQQVMKVSKYLYDDANIYLDRKKKVIEELAIYNKKHT